MTIEQIKQILKNAPTGALVWTDENKYHNSFLNIDSKAKQYQLAYLKQALE